MVRHQEELRGNLISAADKGSLGPNEGPKHNKKVNSSSDAPFYLRKRYYVIGQMMFGHVFTALLQINLSICIVELTSEKIITHENHTISIQRAAYDWTQLQKGIILSSYFWGFVFSPLGASIANKYGGVSTFSLSLFLVGCLTFLSPILIRWNYIMLIIFRTLEGLLTGLSVTGSYCVFTKWIPPAERARLTCLSLLGLPMGSSISYPVTGCITYFFSWEYVLYCTGGATMIWSLIFYFSAADYPIEDKFMTVDEKEYFKRVTDQTNSKKVIIPWRSILTSIPVLAYLNDRFVESWSYSFLLTCIPLYIKDVYPSNIKDIGFLSGIPHFFAILSMIVGSWLMDFLRARKSSNKTKLHKAFILFGQVPGACFLIAIGLWTNFHIAMIALSLFKICYSWTNVSYYSIPLDMCPQYANVIVGLAISCKSIGGIINPIIMGLMVPNHSAEEWSRYFWFISFFNLYGAVVFAKYGTSEVQSWSRTISNEKTKIDY